jgi:hypothetical protein
MEQSDNSLFVVSTSSRAQSRNELPIVARVREHLVSEHRDAVIPSENRQDSKTCLVPRTESAYILPGESWWHLCGSLTEALTNHRDAHNGLMCKMIRKCVGEVATFKIATQWAII